MFLQYYYDRFIRIVGWKVTVISSNFSSSNAYFKYGYEYSFDRKIFTNKNEFPEFTKSQAAVEASKKMFLPILYTVLTTICAFMSDFSGIKPIIDFG